jgi:hypothetical protein
MGLAMSIFDDPAYMAESRSGLVQYVLSGRMPEGWLRQRMKRDPIAVLPVPPEQRRAICNAIRLARGGVYTQFLPRDFPLVSSEVIRAVAAAGGRAAFIAKYGAGE